MANSKTYTLYKDAECTELATAQEVYDAYVSGSMLVVCPDVANCYVIPLNFLWVDSNNVQSDATDVQGVGLVALIDGSSVLVSVGNIKL